MSKSHRSEAFGKTESGFLWCLHCERAYKEEDYRIVKDYGQEFQLCPYEDCNGTTVLDGWAWEKFREYHPDTPKKPEAGKVYPLYPDANEPEP